jgi:hypothetical protein
MKKRITGSILLFFAAAAFAADFGVILGGEGQYTGVINPEGFSLTGYASPWVSVVWNERLNVHASGKLAYDYAEKGEGPEGFFFEVERTEVNWRPVSPLTITLGRQRFQDALGMAVLGLVDGAGGSLDIGTGRFSLGAFYTGLLYKESAKILMTSHDLQQYEKPLDGEGLEGYFASRRVLLALTGEFPGLTPRTGLTVQGLAQLDVNDTSDTLNTHYLEIRFRAEPFEPLHFDLGVVGELVQGEEVQTGAALSGGMDWEVPGAMADLVSAKFLWTSGRSGDKTSAYIPVGGVSMGNIFDPGFRALMSAGLTYQARPLAGLSAGAGAAYFIRTDLESFGDADLDGAAESRLLGGEVYGTLVWVPDPAVRMNLGGGAFFPGWGGAFREDAAVRWKVNVGLIVAL